mgnify:CR=1 FL=1
MSKMEASREGTEEEFAADVCLEFSKATFLNKGAQALCFRGQAGGKPAAIKVPAVSGGLDHEMVMIPRVRPQHHTKRD